MTFAQRAVESSVSLYNRIYDVTFKKAIGSIITDIHGREYIDFFAGAAVLNYGHNPKPIKDALITHLMSDGIIHCLDMDSEAKMDFLAEFQKTILEPRGYDYKVQFTGPTGANGIEAALKLARKVTKRRSVVAFTGSYHGLSAGALSVTSDLAYRQDCYTSNSDVTFLPYDGFFGPDLDTSALLRQWLLSPGGGLARPAALIVETVQAQGGVNVGKAEWLRSIASICKEVGCLLIVDDIQAGCGRTGPFFSFEEAGLVPDIIVLSKAIGACGLPLTVVLLRADIDVWETGEHTGTFRANGLALIAATVGLSYWKDGGFRKGLAENAKAMEKGLSNTLDRWPTTGWKLRGKGMIWGLDVGNRVVAQRIRKAAFQRGLIFDVAGASRTVIKLTPALNIPRATIGAGLEVLNDAICEVVGNENK